jgi:NhaP-type Na+/H+ or K+/H+ antiporter
VNTDTVLSISLLILAYALVSGRVKRGIVTPTLVFLAAGLLLGPHVLDIISPQIDTNGVQSVFKGLAELTLTIMLFLQGSRLDLRKIYGRTTRKTMYGRSLGTLGVLISIVLGTAVALLVFPDFPFWEAAIVAILVVPTESLVKPVIEDRRVPATVRNALSFEEGVSDGLCLGLLLIALAFASNHTEGNAGHWVSVATKGVGMSLVVGAVIGEASF